MSSTCRPLQAKGSEILVCGTCLKFFDLEGKQKIGTVSNMYDISERMHMADKVITPVKSHHQKSWKNVSSSFFLTTILAYIFCPFRLSDRR